MRRARAGTSLARMKPRARITIAQTQRLSLNTSLTAAISVLRADAAGLSAWLEEQAAANPQLVVGKPPAPQGWRPRWNDALARMGGIAGGVEMAEGPGPSLSAHVLAETRRLRLSPREEEIAARIIEALAPSGWLERPLAAIAASAGATMAETAAVLERLQQIDPPGLFARDLAECLRLQAREAGELDPAMAAILSQLPLVAAGDLRSLAALAGVNEAGVTQRIRRLRRYDPKPGAAFAQGAAPVSEPDLIVRRGAGGYEVALNRSSLPALKLADTPGEGRSGARAVIRLVEGRNVTLLRIAAEILRRQPTVPAHGLGGLAPMTMTDVAAAVGLHQSTVSRMVAGTSVDTERGTFWLRAMFSPAVRRGGPAGAALRDALAQMVAAEDPVRPLSDDELARALSGAGAPLARRTVAKYRDMLGIPPAFRRRRAAGGANGR